MEQSERSLGGMDVPPLPCLVGAGGVIPGATPSLRISQRELGRGWDIKVHVCHGGFFSQYTSLVESVISNDRNVPRSVLFPIPLILFLLGVLYN